MLLISPTILTVTACVSKFSYEKGYETRPAIGTILNNNTLVVFKCAGSCRRLGELIMLSSCLSIDNITINNRISSSTSALSTLTAVRLLSQFRSLPSPSDPAQVLEAVVRLTI